MKHCKSFILGAALLLSVSGCNSWEKPNAPINEVSFTNVHFHDVFWTPRIETNRTVSIPSAFYQCEINGRFDNFAIAAGLKKGEHKGDYSFDDTDPYKIIEGASYSLAVKYDAKLDHYLDSVINLIALAQEPDGYLTTCVTNKCYRLSGWWGTKRWEKMNSHELYNSGHLYEAAVAHYMATGKRTLLDVAIKNADLICETFGLGEGQIKYPSGHPIIEMALCKLYKVTGEQKYLDQAKYFVEETGRLSNGRAPGIYSQDHMPILEQEEIVGHAVRAGYLYSGVADYASLANDTEYFEALTRIWENMAGKKLYITGGMGSRPQGEGFGPNYELHNMTNYCETCASIANVYWNYRMFLATGDSKYADIVERAIYNGVMAGVSLSGDRFFYDNPLESMGQHDRAEWFGCACCPGNVTRFVASIPHYMYATQESDIYVNLYTQSEAEIETSSNKVKMTQFTQYPWSGNIEFKIEPETEGEFAIRFRIPDWVTQYPVATKLYSYTDSPVKYSVKVNGRNASLNIHDGYITINRTWKNGDKVELEFPMEVRRVRACDSVYDDRGLLAIQRGPIVYCLEGKDQSDEHVFNKYIPENAEFTEEFKGDLLNGVVVLKTTAKRLNGDGTESEEQVTAIPYSTWNNRGKSEMIVWIPESAEYAKPTPEPTIASKATSFIVHVPIQNDAQASETYYEAMYGVNDQWEPKNSADISKPYHFWWRTSGTVETIEYEFEKPTQVSSVDVYWLEFDHYDGNYKLPEYWTLYYKDGKKWREVETGDKYGIERDMYNHLSFKPVTTTGLRIAAKLQPGNSAGIIEWKVNK